MHELNSAPLPPTLNAQIGSVGSSARNKITRITERPRSAEVLSKRGLDLGLSRGFSGSQAAKHLMGLAAANYAGGPGRRRRHV
ncbi:unnamed protein product [Nesidiocoris tenuis]|uniref:Diuretic hormone class 2 n=1 Tax=Nesidiocoris tenuis TaxID=355587 RepID=A0A6H5GT12_9HEMI|nr:unnamed protein product [Nesidiocoris tenuis]